MLERLVISCNFGFDVNLMLNCLIFPFNSSLTDLMSVTGSDQVSVCRSVGSACICLHTHTPAYLLNHNHVLILIIVINWNILLHYINIQFFKDYCVICLIFIIIIIIIIIM